MSYLFFFFFLHLMHNWSVLLLGNPVSSHFDVEVRANSISQDVHFCACLWLFQPFFVFDATCCRWHFLTLWARWQLPPLWKHPVWSLTMTKYCCSSGRSFLDFILSKVWTEDFFFVVFFFGSFQGSNTSLVHFAVQLLVREQQVSRNILKRWTVGIVHAKVSPVPLLD